MIEFLYEIFSHPPSPLYMNMVLLGGFIVLFGLVSLFVKERLYLSESLVATLVGIAFGPVGLGVVDPQSWFQEHFHHYFQEFARIIIGLQVMAVGVSTPGGYLVKHWRSILMLLGPVTCVMWCVSFGAVKLFLGLGWRESMIIGACVTPTDPVLAHSVIKGKFANRYIPYHLRHLLAVESGANDGLGFPFLMLPILLLISASPAEALARWAVHTWLYEIVFSVLIGFGFGWIARFLLRQSEKRKLVDKDSFLVFSIALTLLVVGVVAILASDDLLAVFIAGNVFAWDEKFVEATRDSHISEVIDMLFNVTFFVFFGSVIPWHEFFVFSIWRLIALAATILIFRRLPVVMLLQPYLPALHSRKEAFFAGWFGPMGVGAIFFALMTRDLFLRHDAVVETNIGHITFPVVTLLVLSSILIHGITVPITNNQLKLRAKRKIKRANKIKAQLEALSMDASPAALAEGSDVAMAQIKARSDSDTGIAKDRAELDDIPSGAGLKASDESLGDDEDYDSGDSDSENEEDCDDEATDERRSSNDIEKGNSTEPLQHSGVHRRHIHHHHGESEMSSVAKIQEQSNQSTVLYTTGLILEQDASSVKPSGSS